MVDRTLRNERAGGIAGSEMKAGSFGLETVRNEAFAILPRLLPSSGLDGSGLHQEAGSCPQNSDGIIFFVLLK